MSKTLKISLGWLYPELMSTYGDRGNVLILKKRCEWRSIDMDIIPLDFSASSSTFTKCDAIFGGGAQDRQQTLVVQDLLNKKDDLHTALSGGTPGLFVCGSPQLFGEYYTTGSADTLPGLNIFPFYTVHPGHTAKRAIGNLVCDVGDSYRIGKHLPYRHTLVGFENHGGRTYLSDQATPFARVIIGNGNNEKDDTEGIRWKNCIATYSHGPFLSKNPHIADWFLHTAITKKYQETPKLVPLDDSLAWQAHEHILNKYNVRGE